MLKNQPNKDARPRFAHLKIPDGWYIPRKHKKRRPHRKTHDVATFQELAKSYLSSKSKHQLGMRNENQQLKIRALYTSNGTKTLRNNCTEILTEYPNENVEHGYGTRHLKLLVKINTRTHEICIIEFKRNVALFFNIISR